MIYFDNNATTAIAPEVYEEMIPFLTGTYGNPSSSHEAGRESRKAIDLARERVAGFLNADPSEIVFTSGGTESDNWAILGALEANPEKRHIISAKTEHEAIRKLCEKLERKGYEVSWLGANEYGLPDLDELKRALRKDTAIVSIMLANNESGVISPIKEMAEIVNENSGALFHTDAVNAAGKIAIDVKDLGIGLLSISGHKFHAPKGIGALYIKNGVKLPPFMTGGGQEKERRAGTEALHQIIGLGKAAELASDLSAMDEVRNLRDSFEDFIFENIPDTALNGDKLHRLPNTSSISFIGIEGEAILAKLNDLGIYVSTGSACNAENHVSSEVLRAMEIPYERAKGTIRFSFGRYNKREEIDTAIACLPRIISGLREIAI